MTHRIRRAIAAVALAGAAIALTASAVPANAAEPVLGFSEGEHPQRLGPWESGKPIYIETDVAKRWKVQAAVAQVRAKTGLDIRTGQCVNVASRPSCITVFSDSDRDTGPTGKRLGTVWLWSTDGQLTAAHIDLDDRNGKRAGAKKRQAKLIGYLTAAVGR